MMLAHIPLLYDKNRIKEENMNLPWILIELRKRGYVIKVDGSWIYKDTGNQLELKEDGNEM